MTVNHLNEIISIFIQRNVCELSDHDLSTAFETNGEACSDEDIRRIVQSFGASLFKLRLNKDGTYFIKIEPTVSSFIYFLLLNIFCHRLIYVEIFSKANVLASRGVATSFICVVNMVIVQKKIVAFHIISWAELIDVLLSRRTVKISIQYCSFVFFDSKELTIVFLR